MLTARKYTPGFTIVELLIVIVVIAILATIAIVSYNGVTRRAIESTLRQDLASGNKVIAMYRATNGTLPQANNCPTPGATEVCLKASSDNSLTYITNGTVPPTSYQLLAARGKIAFLTKDGSAPEATYGSRFVALTNRAQNSDFSAGQTGWTNYSQAASNALFSGGVLTLTADPSGRAWVAQDIGGAYTDNDQIFYSARVRRDSGTGFRLDAYRTGGGFLTIIMQSAQFDAAPIGQFARYSGIRNFVASQGPSTLFSINQSITGQTFQATIDDVVIINLTAAFGAGNEPSAATMDGILGQFNNGWFSGTVTATY